MARVRTAILAAAVGLCTGCFVFDEIDQGRKIMERHGGQSPGARPRAAAAAPATPAEAEPGLLAGAQELLARPLALVREWREGSAPERDPSDVVVTCELEGASTFTHASDCRSRGGRIR
jgi:hypothetical protein